MTFAKQRLLLSDVTPVFDTAAAIIFDNDGTLVDSMPVHYSAWKQALEKYNIQFSEPQFYHLAGLPAQTIIQLLKEQQNIAGVTADQVMTTRSQLLNQVIPAIKPIQPTLMLLQYAQTKNIPIAVASGGERGDVISSLQSADIDLSIFGAVVTSEDVVHGKPHPETFLTAAERLGVDPAKCVGLEDGDKGMEALRAAGMVAVDVRLLDGYPVPKCLRDLSSSTLSETKLISPKHSTNE